MEKRETEMNEKQKKVIMFFVILILLLASTGAITLLVIGYISKDEMLKLAGIITTVVSPSMLLGIIIKLLINNVFHKNIKKTLKNAGLKDVEATNQEIKKNLAIYKFSHYTFIEKENTLIIKMPNDRIDTLQELNNFQNVLPYYIGTKRKEIQNPDTK